jgi:hypothetical protein
MLTTPITDPAVNLPDELVCDPVRMRLLAIVEERPATVAELGLRLGEEEKVVTSHVDVLCRLGCVEVAVGAKRSETRVTLTWRYALRRRLVELEVPTSLDDERLGIADPEVAGVVYQMFAAAVLDHRNKRGGHLEPLLRFLRLYPRAAIAADPAMRIAASPAHDPALPDGPCNRARRTRKVLGFDPDSYQQERELWENRTYSVALVCAYIAPELWRSGAFIVSDGAALFKPRAAAAVKNRASEPKRSGIGNPGAGDLSNLVVAAARLVRPLGVMAAGWGPVLDGWRGGLVGTIAVPKSLQKAPPEGINPTPRRRCRTCAWSSTLRTTTPPSCSSRATARMSWPRCGASSSTRRRATPPRAPRYSANATVGPN